MTTIENTHRTTEPTSSNELGIPAPGYRLPAALRLGRVVLQVSDLDRSLAFYTDVLGLRVLERAQGRATLASSGRDQPIVELRERAGADPVPRRGRLGLYHFAILLPDREQLGRLITHLTALGIRFGASDHLVSEALYLNDPDGLGIEVYADRPRQTWNIADRQLLMDTKPLDLDNLIALAGGEPWRGMPEGTTLGHVHLHVGDVAQASRFYHEQLGLDKIVWTYPGALFLSAGGYHHHLGVNSWAAGASPAGENDARLVEWEIVLPSAEDVSQVARALTGAGTPVGEEADQVTASDPWGTQVRIRSEGLPRGRE